MSYYLIHNLIRRESIQDPLDAQIESFEPTPTTIENTHMMTMETTTLWTNFRENLANDMFAAYMAHRGEQVNG